MSSRFEGYPLAAVEAGVAGLPLLGVGTTALRYLEEFGAMSFASLELAAEALRGDALHPVSPEQMWRAHSPAVVGNSVWDHLAHAAH